MENREDSLFSSLQDCWEDIFPWRHKDNITPLEREKEWTDEIILAGNLLGELYWLKSSNDLILWIEKILSGFPLKQTQDPASTCVRVIHFSPSTWSTCLLNIPRAACILLPEAQHSVPQPYLVTLRSSSKTYKGLCDVITQKTPTASLTPWGGRTSGMENWHWHVWYWNKSCQLTSWC